MFAQEVTALGEGLEREFRDSLEKLQQLAEEARNVLPDTAQGFDAALLSMDSTSGAVRAMRIPTAAKKAKRMITNPAPTSPVSSPMIAKMKSVWAFGRKCHFALPAPSPTPVRPTPVAE